MDPVIATPDPPPSPPSPPPTLRRHPPPPPARAASGPSPLSARARYLLTIAAIGAALALCAARWLSPRPAAAGPRTLPAPARAAPVGAAPVTTPDDVDDRDERRPPRAAKKAVTGKLNLNTATVDQLLLLPGVGPSKAERIIAWRSRHGPFRRVADLRRVKGFGYKTLKRLAANLDVRGESTLRPAT